MAAMPDRIAANRLAALTTALDDAMSAGSDGLSESAVAALLVVRRSEAVSIQEIARRIGLTHSATVRLVDRLEEEWLVRRLSRRGREVQVEATARGKRRSRELLDRRLAVAGGLIERLEPEDRREFARLVSLLLSWLPADADRDRTCRYCDQGACRGSGDCPVAPAPAPATASA